MTASTVPEFSVDVWELRCHYKKARYPQRIAAQEFTVQRSAKPAPAKYNLGPGGQTVMEWFYDKRTNQLVVERHSLEYSDGSTGHRPPDPKYVVRDGKAYKRISGTDDTLREPERKYKAIWKKKLYGRLRRLRCFFFGPRPDPV